MPPDEMRGGSPDSCPNASNSTIAIVPSWAEVYEDAERWVNWTARRRWPDFAANDQVWELYGSRRAAA